MKSPIQQEIEWCENHMRGDESDRTFQRGFIAGLKQALLLLKKEKEVTKNGKKCA